MHLETFLGLLQDLQKNNQRGENQSWQPLRLSSELSQIRRRLTKAGLEPWEPK
jgi:hypothetical protein